MSISNNDVYDRNVIDFYFGFLVFLPLIFLLFFAKYF